MENQTDNKDLADKADSIKPAYAKGDPTSGGRNANDDFNDEKVDDYGINPSAPDAEEQLEYRITVKGGRGPKGGARNPNDDFDSDPNPEDDYKA